MNNQQVFRTRVKNHNSHVFCRYLQRIVDCFHQQALLRIDCLCFSGLQIEEAIIECSDVALEEIRFFTVGRAVMTWIRVVICRYVKTVCGDSSGQVTWRLEQSPKFGRAIRLPRKAASAPDNCNRFASGAAHVECVWRISYAINIEEYRGRKSFETGERSCDIERTRMGIQFDILFVSDSFAWKSHISCCGTNP